MLLGIAGDVLLRWGWRWWRARRTASGTTSATSGDEVPDSVDATLTS